MKTKDLIKYLSSNKISYIDKILHILNTLNREQKVKFALACAYSLANDCVGGEDSLKVVEGIKDNIDYFNNPDPILGKKVYEFAAYMIKLSNKLFEKAFISQSNSASSYYKAISSVSEASSLNVIYSVDSYYNNLSLNNSIKAMALTSATISEFQEDLNLLLAIESYI